MSQYLSKFTTIFFICGAFSILGAMFLIESCTEESNDSLAPYKGQRMLDILHVTQSYTPDIQWLGGRVAAIGVNRGTNAVMDSSLLWLMTSDDNNINSYVTVGMETNVNRIMEVGGIPEDSLDDEQIYTFWVAEKSIYDANLDTLQRNGFNFADTTVEIKFGLKGKAGGEKDAQGNLVVTTRVYREESLLADVFILDWTPSDIPFRRIAIRESSFGGFTDLIWHVLTPDSLDDNIYPPVVIGSSIPNTIEAIPWATAGFQTNTVYFVWMANENWTENDFSPSATGYAWYRIYAF